MPDFMVELRALTAESEKMLGPHAHLRPHSAKSSICSGCQIGWKKGRWVISGNPAVGRYPADGHGHCDPAKSNGGAGMTNTCSPA